MAKNKNEDKKPPSEGDNAPDEKDQAAEIRVKILVTAQGPELRLMAGHVETLPAALAAALIKAGSAEKYVEKAADKKAEDRETR